MHELLSISYVRIVCSTLAVYFFIVVAIRLFGKKELAQLSVVDLVFILLISNSVQNAMVGPDATLSGGLVAATSLFVVNYILKYLQYRFPRFGKVVQGDAILLVYQGKIINAHMKQACTGLYTEPDESSMRRSMRPIKNKLSRMKKAKISEAELMEAVREHGVASVEEVDLAIMEVDGSISVLSNKYQKKTVKRHRGHKVITKQNG